MLSGSAAVAEDVLVRAAGFFQGVGQHRQAVEGSLLVDGLSELRDGAVTPRQPGTEFLLPLLLPSLRW